jgi:GT2 family glycosyltransferase
VCIVILNYNAWKLTISLIESLSNIALPKDTGIVVVDNCSPNESYEELKQWNYKNKKFKLIQSTTNNGYAAGNNIGLRYAYSKGYDYAWILNNDIIFLDKEVLVKMLSCFNYDENIVSVSPRIITPQGYETSRFIYRPTVFSETIGFLLMRYRDNHMHRENRASENWTYTYRPQGCCFISNLNKINECDYFDEHTFLYCEEPILAERLAKIGGRCACALNTQVLHNHSTTVASSIAEKKKQKIIRQSREYLWMHYYHWSQSEIIFIEQFWKLRGLVVEFGGKILALTHKHKKRKD